MILLNLIPLILSSLTTLDSTSSGIVDLKTPLEKESSLLFSFWPLLGKLLGVTFLLLLLVAFMLYHARNLKNPPTSLTKEGKIALIDSHYLGPKTTLYLYQIEDHRFLLISDHQGVRSLAQWHHKIPEPNSDCVR